MVMEEEKVPAVSGVDEDVKIDISEDKEKMTKAARQIEFYFADSNLPYDKFMWTLYTKDPDHWVPIETVASFKRMREYTPLGLPWITNALRTSEELEVDELGTKVRRRTEVQEPKGQFERSVYAKGFPDEDATLQSKLEDFFAKYGKTNAVRMRRDENKKFKNSVFAEFTDFKTVEEFLTANPKPSWDGQELLIMSKEAYCDMKIKEKGLTGKSASHRKELLSSSRGFNAFREMARAKSSSAKQANGTSAGASSTEPKKDIYLEFLGSKLLIHRDEEGNGTVKAEDVPFLKGSTLRFDGCGGSLAWHEVKEPLKEKFDNRAPYIKYSRGDDFGLVGFHQVLSEEDIEKVKEAVKTINGKSVTWGLVEELEEKEFQIERAQAAARGALSAHSFPSSSRGGSRGRGSRGSRGGRGARGGRSRGGGRGRGGREREDGKEEIGEKRKRAVEPDGGPDVGLRGNTGPPVLASTVKKVKVDGGEES